MHRAVRLLIVVLVALAGCGGDDDESSSEGSVVQTIAVKLTDFKLDPANPTVTKTGKVRFEATNDGQAPHSIEVEGPSGEAEIEGELKPGASGSLDVDLDEPGTYEWYCPVGDHKDRGMRGEIKVAGGGSGSSSEDEDEGESAPSTSGY